VRKCNAQFLRESQSDDELATSIVLIQALLAQGKQADAEKELVTAQATAAKSQNSLLRMQFGLASARVALTSDDPAASRRALQRVIQEARGYGFLGIEFEAQFWLAELEKKTGHSAAAQQQLLSLEKEAHAKGFGLIARKLPPPPREQGSTSKEVFPRGVTPVNKEGYRNALESEALLLWSGGVEIS